MYVCGCYSVFRQRERTENLIKCLLSSLFPLFQLNNIFVYKIELTFQSKNFFFSHLANIHVNFFNLPYLFESKT